MKISEEDGVLLAQAAEWPECTSLSECSPHKLAEIARNRGLEFATAVLYDRVLRERGNQEFFQRVQAATKAVPTKPTLVGIVPGAFYRQHRNTGADGARLMVIAEAMMCRVERIPVDSFGSLNRNAMLIREWLVRNKEARVVLLSLSKGSADLKVALGLPDACKLFSNVAVWVSLSGLPQGTPLIAWLRRQPLRRLGVRLLLLLRGQRYSVVEELRHEANGPLAAWPDLPPHLSIIHVAAFPLRRHLAHPWAPRAYERLAPLGPNDGGGFLLSDVARIPGQVFPVWGADHYLQPDWDVASIFRRVLAEAMSVGGEFRQANQSATPPINPPASRSIA
ncbi:MAG: hypothetical protein JWR26_401 [Pedosphaera sp.]|nr:hypothetical protein [Pedosphaera sp.]